MPRTRLSREGRRRVILDAGRDLFAAAGYHQTTVAQLARDAGVTAPVLYAHFASKRDLYLAVLGDQAEELGRYLGDHLEPATEDLETRLVGVAHGIVAFARERPAGWKLLVEPPVGEPALLEAHRGIRNALVGSAADVTRRDPDFSPPPRVSRQTAVALFGELQWSAYESLGRWASAHPQVSAHQTVAVFMDLIWVGLERFRTRHHWSPRPAD